MPRVRRLGADAEDRAAAYLIDLGYTILKRGYKAPHGEIDILALDGDVLVVVEVKERTKQGYLPEQSVGVTKARRLSASAAALFAIGRRARARGAIRSGLLRSELAAASYRCVPALA